jgi:preprotein translocase subunit SecG
VVSSPFLNMGILLTFLTMVLILTSIVLILLVLMQKAKSDGGMGAAMGGGMAEATFGAETGNVLSGATIKAAVVFFVLSFGLYLGRIYQGKHASASSGASLPVIAGSASPAAAAAPLKVSVPASASPTQAPAQKP